MLVKVGILVSYDYDFIRSSLPLLYNDADQITLALDKNRKTWNGESYTIDSGFFDWISAMDTQLKVKIYEDDFYIPGLSTIENDTRERMMLADFMGQGGWHLQIDSDEYFVDFSGFVQYLKSMKHYLAEPEKTPIDICVFWTVLYKKVPTGFLYVRGSHEVCFAATNFPNYTAARAGNNKRKFAPFSVLHQTWARGEEEIKMKFRNWSHNIDFNTSAYYQMWKSADERNYHMFHNLHPLKPSQWRALGFVRGVEIKEVVGSLKASGSLKVPKRILFKYWLKELKRRVSTSFKSGI